VPLPLSGPVRTRRILPHPTDNSDPHIPRNRSGEDPGMESGAVMRWVAGYERAWRDGDLGAVERLFSADVHYRKSPYEPDAVGHDAVREFWAEDAGLVFTVRAEPVAVQGPVAVVRLLVRYETPDEQEYRDLWVLRFAADGRVEDFEEWAYFPGQPYTTDRS
jgi:ketosteroid isomerase-like protein